MTSSAGSKLPWPAVTRFQERGPAPVIECIHVGMISQENLDDIAVPRSRRIVQSGHAVRGGCPRQVRISLQQNLGVGCLALNRAGENVGDCSMSPELGASPGRSHRQRAACSGRGLDQANDLLEMGRPQDRGVRAGYGLDIEPWEKRAQVPSNAWSSGTRTKERGSRAGAVRSRSSASRGLPPGSAGAC